MCLMMIVSQMVINESKDVIARDDDIATSYEKWVTTKARCMCSK